MGNEAREYIEKRIQYLQNNEGLKQTRKPNAGKMQGGHQGGFSQKSEFIKRRNDNNDEDEGPRKKFKGN